MKYRGILFDLDGTLLDTLEDLTDAVNYAMQKYGFSLKTIEQVRAYVGNGLENLMTLCIPDGKEHQNFTEIYLDFKAFYLSHSLVKTKPYKGIIKLLEKLKAEGCSMAVISNKNDIAVKELNEAFFKDIVPVAIGESENVRKKPAPDSVYEAMSLLKLKPEECVYIGDSDVDILTAKNAGLPCISVTWGFRDKGFLAEHGAEVFADSPAELYDYLER